MVATPIRKSSRMRQQHEARRPRARTRRAVSANLCCIVGGVLSEQLLELIDDHQSARSSLAATARRRRPPRPVVAAASTSPSPRRHRPSRRQRPSAATLTGRCRVCRSDGAPAGPCGRNQACTKERSLACARRPDQPEHPRRPLELAPHLLDLGLAAEEVLGISFGEGCETGVGVEVVGALDSEGHVLEGAGESVGGVVSVFTVLS